MPRKGVRKGARRATAAKARDMLFRDEDGQSYALVTAMLGNGRLHARCEDGEVKLCKIRGAMRRSQWISVGDVVLVSLRDFQTGKADVLHVYPADDVHRLRKLGELEALTLDAAAAAADAEGDVDVVFEHEDGADYDADPLGYLQAI